MMFYVFFLIGRLHMRWIDSPMKYIHIFGLGRVNRKYELDIFDKIALNQ